VSIDPRGNPVAALNYEAFVSSPPLRVDACVRGPIPAAVDAQIVCRVDAPGAVRVALVNRPALPVLPFGSGVINLLRLSVTDAETGSVPVCIDSASIRLGSILGSDLCAAPPACGAVEVDTACLVQGDCNCDGRVNGGDRVCLVSKFFQPSLGGTCACEDCNLSGEPNAADAPCITLCAFGQCPAIGEE
jgi:hypothetical protein